MHEKFQATFDQVPEDLFFLIFSVLDFKDLRSNRLVSRRWRQLADDDALYRRLVQKDFPLYQPSSDTADEDSASAPLPWLEVYKRCYTANVSGVWVDHGRSTQYPAYPDVEFPFSLLHNQKDNSLTGSGTFPAQTLWQRPLKFSIGGTLNRLQVSLKVHWPIGYGWSTLNAVLDVHHPTGLFRGTWATYPSYDDSGLDSINTGSFIAKRINLDPHTASSLSPAPPLPEAAVNAPGLDAWDLDHPTAHFDGGPPH